MLITKHSADEEGLIHIYNCVRLLTMGLQDNVVTIWAVTDPVSQTGIAMNFVVKKDGDLMTVDNCAHYITSFINDNVIWHLIGDESKIKHLSPLKNS